MIVLVVLMLVFKLNIYAVIFANASFGLIMSLLNAFSLKKYAGYKQELVKTFFIPLLAAGVMGVLVFGAYKLLMLVLHINLIATLCSIIIGVIVYFVILLLAKGVTETELRRLPKGHLLVSVAKKAHLLK